MQHPVATLRYAHRGLEIVREIGQQRFIQRSPDTEDGSIADEDRADHTLQTLQNGFVAPVDGGTAAHPVGFLPDGAGVSGYTSDSLVSEMSGHHAHAGGGNVGV